MTTNRTTHDARRIVDAALKEHADQLLATAAPSGRNRDQVLADAALARAMSDRVSGWTHTTRLRDFLESSASADAVAKHLADRPVTA